MTSESSEPPSLPTHDIVVCVHNAPKDTELCLASLVRHIHRCDRILIVDDCSEDDTRQMLEAFARRHRFVELIRSDERRYYTRAANIGLKASSAEFVTLLNSDTIVTARWRERILRVFAQSPYIGIVGPLSNAASTQSVPAVKSSKDQTAINELPPGVDIDEFAARIAELAAGRVVPFVPLIQGFCFSIRRSVIDAIGYFDEESFPHGYGEQNDYCCRAEDGGFLLALALDAYMFNRRSQRLNAGDRSALIKAATRRLVAKYGQERIRRSTQFLQENPHINDMCRATSALIAETLDSRCSANGCFPDSPQPKRTRGPAIFHDKPRVTLVMLVRDSLLLTRQAISSILERTDYGGFDLIVVDNASGNETKTYLSALAKDSDRIRVVTNSENKSFSQANNEAAAFASGELLLFVNNDIEIVEGGWLKLLVDEITADDLTGAVGPTLLYPNNLVQSAGLEMELDNQTVRVPVKEHKTRRPSGFVHGITAACMLVRRTAHELIGGFDERFFYGQEDIDYCLKLREAGLGIKHVSSCTVIHHESATRTFNVTTLRNRQTLRQKWHGRAGAVLNRPATPISTQSPGKKSYLELLRSAPINFITLADMAQLIRQNPYLIPEKIDLVVGMPRSGLIPAYIIGQLRNVMVLSLDEFVSGIAPTRGDRLQRTHDNELLNVLVVDDSINLGNSFRRVKALLKPSYRGIACRFTFLAVYASENWCSDEVLTIARCRLPRLFEWNYLNHGIAAYSCFDLDGVLCVDPTEEENDDGALYEEFVRTARPLHIPMYRIKAIVTSRLEKYRRPTEQWLAANGVKYERLWMLDLPSKAERLRLGAHAKFKAEVFSRLEDTFLFVESNSEQAREIARITGKSVVCTANSQMYTG